MNVYEVDVLVTYSCVINADNEDEAFRKAVSFTDVLTAEGCNINVIEPVYAKRIPNYKKDKGNRKDNGK